MQCTQESLNICIYQCILITLPGRLGSRELSGSDPISSRSQTTVSRPETGRGSTIRVLRVSPLALGMAGFLSRYPFGQAHYRPSDGMNPAPKPATIFALHSSTDALSRWACRTVVSTSAQTPHRGRNSKDLLPFSPARREACCKAEPSIASGRAGSDGQLYG